MGNRGWSLLGSPVFVISVMVLLLNDHVLKPAWPGFVTGKLSDVAGVAMIALFLTALTRSAPAGFGVAAIAFALLKTIPFVAVIAMPILGGVTRTDPTDVLAIVVLVPLWRWIHRRGECPPSEWRRPVQVVAVVAGVVAMTATSADCAPAGVSAVALAGDQPVALVDGVVFRSADGARTWAPDEASPPVPLDSADGWESQQSCWADSSCVAIDDTDGVGLRIVRLAADQKSELLSLTIEDVRLLQQNFRSGCGPEFGRSVLAVENGSEKYALVTMGTAGLLRIDVSGEAAWVAIGEFGFREDQVGVTTIEVASTVSSPWWSRVPRQAAVVALLLAGPAVALAVRPIRRSAKRNRRDATGATGVCIGTAIVIGVAGWGLAIVAPTVSDDPRLAGFAAVLWAIGILVVVSLLIWHRRPPPARE